MQREAMGQSLLHQGLHLGNGDARNPVAQTPHRLALEPAGHHGSKAAQITIHIQGQTVLGNPTAAPHTNGRQLAALQPNAGHAVDPFTHQARLRQHVDHHLLQLTQVPMQIALAAAQIQHRIGHQLTGHVMGHLPTPINAMQRSRGIRKIKQQMVLRSAPPKGVTAEVLQQPHRLRALGDIRFGASTAVDLQHALLPMLLPLPGLGEIHQLLRLKKKCRRRLGCLVWRL